MYFYFDKRGTFRTRLVKSPDEKRLILDPGWKARAAACGLFRNFLLTLWSDIFRKVEIKVKNYKHNTATYHVVSDGLANLPLGRTCRPWAICLSVFLYPEVYVCVKRYIQFVSSVLRMYNTYVCMSAHVPAGKVSV